MSFTKIKKLNIAIYKNNRKLRSRSLTEVKECNEFTDDNIDETSKEGE